MNWGSVSIGDSGAAKATTVLSGNDARCDPRARLKSEIWTAPSLHYSDRSVRPGRTALHRGQWVRDTRREAQGRGQEEAGGGREEARGGREKAGSGPGSGSVMQTPHVCKMRKLAASQRVSYPVLLTASTDLHLYTATPDLPPATFAPRRFITERTARAN